MKLWNLDNLAEWQMSLDHNSSIRGLAFHPNGQFLVSTGDDHVTRIWDVHSGTTQKILHPSCGRLWTGAVSPNGKDVAVGCENGTVRVWNLARQAVEKRRVIHWPTIMQRVAMDSTASRLALIKDRGKTVSIFDSDTGTLVANISEPEPRQMTALAFSADGRSFWIANDIGMVRLFDLTSGEFRQTIKPDNQAIRKLQLSPSGRFLAMQSSGQNQTSKVWNIKTGQTTLAFKTTKFPEPRFRISGFLSDQVVLTVFMGRVTL